MYLTNYNSVVKDGVEDAGFGFGSRLLLSRLDMAGNK